VRHYLHPAQVEVALCPVFFIMRSLTYADGGLSAGSTGGQTVERQRLAIVDDAHHHGLTVQTCVEASLPLPEQAA
jgi:hypothetical protein